ncbi:uncharacterized protein L3040_007796 [Drepanopeziza brunnea f. sp. 'multigermtubi']|uniref:uncharacterized protein n=1 Tax=Drepanopeziza brunnea f. sp. 'multigermtubi' TaxID=698441 RepID=UPI00239E3B5B|nr:hypothetical protein L3040_007796 [Drepanopeziza brunnea f. sp. 'multigermtubi']
MTVPTRAQRIASIAKHTAAIIELTAQSSTTDEKLQEIENRLAYLQEELQPMSDSAASGKKKKGGDAGIAASGGALENANAVREVKGSREDGGDEKNKGEQGTKRKRRKKRMKGKGKKEAQSAAININQSRNGMQAGTNDGDDEMDID